MKGKGRIANGKPGQEIRVAARGWPGTKTSAFLVVGLLLLQLHLGSPLHADTLVRVGIYQNAPLSFMDDQGRADGLVPDLLEAVAAREGWRIEYVPCEWVQCLAMLEAGEIDLLGAIAYSDKRAQRFDFNAQTYFTNWGVVYTLPDADIQSVLDLDGRKLVILQEDIYSDAVQGLLEEFGVDVHFLMVQDYHRVFDAVQNGEADAGVVNRLFGAQFGVDYGLVATPVLFNPIEVRFAATKGEHTDLLAAIDASLTKWKADPDSPYYQALDRSLTTPQPWHMPDWLRWALGLLAAGLVLFLGTSLLLRWLVHRRTDQLRQSEERNRVLLESIPDLVLRLNRKSVILDYQSAVGEPLRMSAEQFLGKSASDVLPPELAQTTTDCVARALETGEIQTFDYQLPLADGLHHLEARFVPSTEDEVITIVRDISERVQAEEALRESRERLLKAEQVARMGFLDWNLETNEIELSDEIIRLFGIDPDRRRTTPEFVAQLVHPDDLDYVNENLNLAVAGEKDYNIDYRVVRPDGEILWLHHQGQLVRDQDGKPKNLLGSAVDITERKKVEEALRRSLAETDRRNRLLLALSQAGQAVQRARTPEDVYRAISEQVAGLGFETTVFTLTDDRAHLALAHLAVKPGLVRAGEKLTGLTSEGYRFPLSPGGFLQRIVQEGKPAFSHLDAAPIAEALPRPVRPLAGRLADLMGWQQSILAPLTVSGEGQGLLIITGDDLTEADVPMVSVLADQASAALENTRLLQAEHEQRELAEALRQAAQAMGASLDLNDVLRLLLDQLRRVLVYDTASVLILREGDRPDLVVGRGYADEAHTVQEAGQLLQDSPILRQMARDLQPVVSADVRRLEGWTWVPGAEHVRSWLGIPLISQGRMIGALMADHARPGFYGETELQSAQALAQHAAQAIENARLYDEARRHSRELALLNRVIAASAASQDVPSILETTCRELALAFDVPQAAATLFNAEKTEALVVAEYLAEGRLPALGEVIPAVGNPASQYVLEHKKPLVIEEAQTDPRQAPIHDLLRRRGTVSLLLLPLIVEGEVVGTLGLDAIEPRSFSSAEVELARRVAEQVSGALARARLEEARRLLTTAIEQADEAMLITDTEGIVAYVNPAFERITGLPSARFLGQSSHLFEDHALPPLSTHAEMWQAVSAGQAWQGQLNYAKPDGQPYNANVSITPVRDAADQIVNYVVTLRDVTHEVELEKQVRQAQKMEAVGQMAGGVAHDFNNLLTVIQLSARLLEKQLHPQDPLLAYVERIQDTGQRAANLTKQLLSFSRGDVIAPQVLNLNQVLGDLGKMLRRMIPEDVELVQELAEDLWPVYLDPTQVDQVIVNLAVNARDAMPNGGTLTIETANVVLDRAYAALHLEVQPGEYVRLTVRDSGLGMGDEVKAHLFEPFFTTKEVGQGTGLGLATVYGIVKRNQGHIEVHSQVGQGTTFHIYVPRATETIALRAAPPPAIQAQATGGGETILVVEDEPAVLDVTLDILEESGYRVLTAASGAQALQVSQAHQGRIDLLLTDVVMPSMSGRELAEHLRSQRPEMRVLYASGYADDTLSRRGMPERPGAFLHKPFTLESLTQKVRAVLDGDQ